MNKVLLEVTHRIVERSRPVRERYLAQVESAKKVDRLGRMELSCTNLAHAFAAMPEAAKERIKASRAPNLAIVSSYNDMLSAHQPLKDFPQWIKEAVFEAGATAQFAGGTPAMCDGVTQGRPGMELSLFSRDVIAQSTAIALSHLMFDGGLYLGVCDKIVPGLLMGALSFGHLPAIFVPAGPMTSGIANDEKAKTRQLFAEGKVGREALLESEAQSYHSAGTCTFYGTANSNQMMMELMGLHLPGAAFANPNTPIRELLTRAAGTQAVRMVRPDSGVKPLGEMVDEKTIVNAVVGLLATGGSTNHTLHLIAIARCAGIDLRWSDFSDLSAIIPLLMRVYPNGKADVNHFHAAGGLGFVIRELIEAGLVHEDVSTVMGQGLSAYAQEPCIRDGQLSWQEAPKMSGDENVLRPVSRAFSDNGGLKMLHGNIGRAVIKVSAVAPEHRVVEAPAKIFHDQQSLIEAFNAGQLNEDFVAVVRYQGPKANGMPELHQLTPQLTSLQQQGYKVALVTDGRMSGASGKVPAAIHVSPEALLGGMIGRIHEGDVVRVDAENGVLEVLVSDEELAAREVRTPDLSANQMGTGRELFTGFRMLATPAEEGAMSFPHPLWQKK